MKPFRDIEDEIRKYLLGTLVEESRRGVEERLMTEEAFLEELTLVEGELIDDYVDGRLGVEERAGFEQHFLATEERRAQLRLTRALGRYATSAVETREAAAESDAATATTPPTTTKTTEPTVTISAPTLGERLRAFWGGRSAAWRAGLAFAAVACLAVAVWLAVPRAPRTFASLTLAAGAGERAGGVEVPKVRLPLGADALRVTLTLPAGTTPADAYRAEMLTLGDGRTEAVEVAGHDGRTVTVVVPEDRLARGRYALRLYASGVGGGERRVGDSYVFDAE
jgi:anti-sigma-K factor RskA